MAHTRFLGWPFVGLVSTQSGMTAAIDQLTEKEKETLRLIVRGHDAKSAATELNLSVHTINERLRSARRKLDVTSSREAARVLYESEAQAAERTPKKLAYEHLGDAAMLPSSDDPSIRKRGRSPALWIGGIIMMMMTLAAAIAFVQSGGWEVQTGGWEARSEVADSSAAAQEDAIREQAAREWLALVDKSDLETSFAATTSAFRSAVDLAMFKSATAAARAPLGEVLERRAIQFTTVNEAGKTYEIALFRTDFENRVGVIERVAMERDGGQLKVGGYFIQ